MKKVWILAALAAGLNACLLGETFHSLCLEPDGARVWSVLEKDVRSDGKTWEIRWSEEEEYLELVAIEEHPVAAALRELGALEVGTSVLRAERPYTVLTEARFDSVAEVARRILERLGIPGYAELRIDGDTAGFEFVLWPLEAEEDDAAGDSPLFTLLAEAMAYRWLLTEGRFLDASGFTLLEGGTAAVLEEIGEDQLEAREGELRLSLSWTLGGS